MYGGFKLKRAKTIKKCVGVGLLLALGFCILFASPPPRLIFWKKLEFVMPLSAKIEGYAFNFFDYENMEMKVSFDEAAYPVMLNGLEKYCQKYGLVENGYDDMDMSYHYVWWDARDNEILFARFAYIPERQGEKLRVAGIAVAQGTDGQYFLYITHRI